MSKRNRVSTKIRAVAAAAGARAPAKPVAKGINGPTPEQFTKADYERPNALHYRRRPLFETLAKTCSWIGDEELRALKLYREWFENSNKSLTRCSLDVDGRGGGVPSGMPPIIGASFSLQLCRGAIGNIVDVFDKVALEDKSFSEVAIERYGSRRQSWLKQPSAAGAKAGKRATFTEKIVPKSGRHREIVTDEFRAGLKRLVDVMTMLTTTTRRLVAVPVAAAPVPLPVEPEELAAVAHDVDTSASLSFVFDPRFMGPNGYMRPYGEIAAILLGRDPDAEDMAA